MATENPRILSPRSSENRRGYEEGWRYGWQWVIARLREGHTVDDIERDCESFDRALVDVATAGRTQQSGEGT